MEKKNTQELSEMIIQMTVEYTKLYFKHVRDDQIDRQMWAALFVGFMTGAMEFGGYTEKEIMDANILAMKEIDSALNIVKNLKK